MVRNKLIVIALILGMIFLFISYIPNIYEATLVDKMPQDRVMIWGEHIYITDYNAYLNKIRQGMEGRWTTIDKYDNNTRQNGVFLQTMYVLAGKFGGILHFTPSLTFHLLRTVLSFAWVIVIIYLNFSFIKNSRLALLGTILCLLAGSFPFFTTMGEEKFWIKPFMDWWQEMDVMKRISYIPHYTLNYIFIALMTVMLSLFAKTNRNKYVIFIIVGLFLSFFIHPAGGLVFIGSWIIYHAINIFIYRNYSRQQITRIMVVTLTMLIIASLPLLYIAKITSAYPWKTLIDFEKNYRASVNIVEYVLALGPVFFTGMAAVVYVLITKQQQLLPLATWPLAAFILIILFKLFPYQSELRFVQTANHIPLAILTAYFAGKILAKFKNTIVKPTVYCTITLIIILGIAQAIYSIKGQTLFDYQRAVASLPLVPYPPQVMHHLKDVYMALLWLDKNTSKSTVILSKINAGLYIPVYSGNYVYLGHGAETPNFNVRETEVNNFFSGTMSSQEARQFLIDRKIDYVYYGPQERDNMVRELYYEFLIPVFQTSQVTIFSVKK